MEWTATDFQHEYHRLKKEQLLTDLEIAEEMGISNMMLYYMKSYFRVDEGKRPRKNYLGFTEEMLQKGEEIGLSRRLMYKRVREYQWSHQRAITEPRNQKGRKGYDRGKVNS